MTCNLPMDKKTAIMYSPLTLAYLGDCVYEIYVREKLVCSGNLPNGKLHSIAKKYVSASGQSSVLNNLIPLFSEEELLVFKRGRNSSSNPGKNCDLSEYHRATGLEALFGYLYLIGENTRIKEFFEIIWKSLD